jgi:RimJ/RimL family protein N-acetyltransferase
MNGDMNLKLVENNKDYYEVIRSLRTHPDNTNGFLEQVEITPEQQIKYMEKYEKNYWICLLNESPVGFVGVVESDIRLAVDPKFKNKGIGTFMINELKKINSNITSKVLLGNIPSQKVFEKCGFILYEKDDKFKYYKL